MYDGIVIDCKLYVLKKYWKLCVIKRKQKKFVKIKRKLHVREYSKMANLEICAYETLLWLTNYLRQRDIFFWLTYGSLLGSIRANGFAGRPSDIDIGIFSNQKSVFLKSVASFACVEVDSDRWLSFFYAPTTEFKVDVTSYSFLLPKEKKVPGIYYCDQQTRLNGNFLGKGNADDFVKAKVLDCDVYVPYEASGLLRNIYGNHWRIPATQSFL